MDARYERNMPALSAAECETLRGKRVLVVGCGGLGGYLIDFLARIGVGALRVVDGDVFEESNLNRQLLSEVPLLGTGKAEAAAHRVHRVNPVVSVEVEPVFLTAANACSEAGIPYIYGAVTGWIAQAAVSAPGDGLVELLYPQGAVLKSKSVLSFTPALCAAMQVSLCVKLLTGREVKTGTVYYFDLLNQEFEAIPLL